jgi:hypothetical protein
MTDDERGYRTGRPPANVIPPDRRRVKRLALIAGGMLLGAGALAVLQALDARRAAARDKPSIRAFAAAAEINDVTSGRAGAIAKDGQPDRAFVLDVDGPLIGIVLTTCDAEGHPEPFATQWGTLVWNPLAPDQATYGPPVDATWQLSVSENGRSLNDARGALSPLPAARHRLVLHVSYAPATAHFCAWAIGPEHDHARGVSASNPVEVVGRPEPGRTPPN